MAGPDWGPPQFCSKTGTGTYTCANRERWWVLLHIPYRLSRSLFVGLLVGIATLMTTATPALASAIDGGYVSLYPSGPYSGAGWATCSTPITWFIDIRALKPATGKKAVADATWAMSTWSNATGTPSIFGGVQSLNFDNAKTVTGPEDGAQGGRKIYIKFVKDQDSNYLSGRIMGAASPTSIIPTNAEITGGSAVFRADYFEYATKTESRALLLHELGHVYGLGHSADQKSVMYPIVAKTIKLNANDKEGITAFKKTCDPNLESQRTS